MTKISGHCLCGAVTWQATAKTTRNLVCHCTDCQRATAAPFTAFLGFVPHDVAWGGQINHFESSPGTWRGFCPACGTRLYFRSDKWPEEIHVHAATLAVGIAYSPTAEVVTRSRAQWLDHLGDVPKHIDFHAPPRKGGAK